MKYLNNLFYFLKINIKVYFLALLGCLSFFAMFYIRFIRERLPQNIPFSLTELRFYVVLFICIGFFYVIKNLLKPVEPNEYLLKLITYISTPFRTFDNLLKTNYYSLSYMQQFLKHIYPKKCKTQIYIYVFLQLIPRITLVSIFLLDVFYFHKLYYFYIFMFISIFSWIYLYHKYSMYHAKELGLTYLEMFYTEVDIFEQGWADVENNFELDEEGNITDFEKEWIPHPRNKYHAKLVTIRKYFQILLEKDIDETINNYAENDYYAFEPAAYSQEYRYEQYKKLTGKTELNQKDYNVLRDEFNEIMPILQKLNYHLHYLPDMEKKYYMSEINIIIYILWLIAWSYILITSLPTLQDMPMTLEILKILTMYSEYFDIF